MPLENTVGAEQSETEEAPEGMTHLAQLLEESEPASETVDDTNSDAGGSHDAKLTKFNDLAGRLNIELDDLYKLEVSQSEDGTPVTVESLKDLYASQGDFSLREIEFEERRTTQESELMQAQEELRELMAAMPERSIKPEVLQKLRDKHEAQLTLEKQRTLDVIPQWQDEKIRTTEITGMVEHLKQYGYPVDHLGRISDHRQLKYIRDNWQREQRVRTALAKVRAGKPNPTTGNKPANKAPSKSPLTGVKRGNSRNKLDAIFSNL